MKTCLGFCTGLFIFANLIGFAQDTLVSNLPIVIINTDGQTITPDTNIFCDMGIIYNGVGAINHINDPLNNYDGKISIRKRGSTTLGYPKNSYRIETQDLEGQNLNVSLIDLPKENDWVLYGPFADKSLMRNVLIYELARRMGWYAPRTKFCEVVLNDEYIGVYVLIEKIKRDKNRVDISKLSPMDTTGADLTGGYLIQVDRWEGAGWHSAFNWNIYFEYIYPDDDEIIPSQENYIQSFIYFLEDSLYNLTAFNDNSLNGIIDVYSFIDYIILNEFSKNADAYRLSTYFYKDHDSIDGRLKMGPVWDYNFAFGNYCDFLAYETENFIYDDTTFWNHSLFWFRKLMTFGNFQNKVRCRWEELRQNQLSEDSISSIIDSCYTFLFDAQQRNFQKWDILGYPVWPNYYYGDTYEEEIEILEEWIFERMLWLDDNFPGECINTPVIGNDSTEKDVFVIFPNPFSSSTTIEYTLSEKSTIDLKFYNQYGKLINTEIKENLLPGSYQIKFNTNGLSPGLYYFQFIINGQSVEVKSAVKNGH